MSPATELTWLGMSEERMLVAMDSSGLLSALTQVLLPYKTVSTGMQGRGLFLTSPD